MITQYGLVERPVAFPMLVRAQVVSTIRSKPSGVGYATHTKLEIRTKTRNSVFIDRTIIIV